MKTYNATNFSRYCNLLKKNHANIHALHNKYGAPPYWRRENSFEALCKTIIEQQVSLASANAVFDRLKKSFPFIEPQTIAFLSQEKLCACGITRQKANYIKCLAEVLLQEPNFLYSLHKLNNTEAKNKLMSIKGIGNWTANVYLLDALNRIDIYPDFDVALMQSISYEAYQNKLKLDNEMAKEFISQFAPYRSIACLYYYHAYILRKGVVFIP